MKSILSVHGHSLAPGLTTDAVKPITQHRMREACSINLNRTPEARRLLIESLIRDISLVSDIRIPLMKDGVPRNEAAICEEVFELIPQAEKVCKLSNNNSIDQVVSTAEKFNKLYGANIQVYSNPLNPASEYLDPESICGQMYDVQDSFNKTVGAGIDSVRNHLQREIDNFHVLKKIYEKENAPSLGYISPARLTVMQRAEPIVDEINLAIRQTVAGLSDSKTKTGGISSAILTGGSSVRDINKHLAKVESLKTGGAPPHLIQSHLERLMQQGGKKKKLDHVKMLHLIAAANHTNAEKANNTISRLPVKLSGGKKVLRDQILHHLGGAQHGEPKEVSALRHMLQKYST